MYPTHTINNREVAFLVNCHVLLLRRQKIQLKKGNMPRVNHGKLTEAEEPQASFI